MIFKFKTKNEMEMITKMENQEWIQNEIQIKKANMNQILEFEKNYQKIGE